MIKRGQQKSKEDVTEVDDAFKARVDLDQIQAHGPTGYQRKRAHVFAPAAHVSLSGLLWTWAAG